MVGGSTDLVKNMMVEVRGRFKNRSISSFMEGRRYSAVLMVISTSLFGSIFVVWETAPSYIAVLPPSSHDLHRTPVTAG
jgi:hypothetical protein